eukprot:15482980-Alexandrium_andersonii.AAC.1
MHCVDLGYAQRALPNILLYLLKRGCYGSENMCIRIARLYHLYRGWCRSEKQGSWCERFTEERFHLKGKDNGFVWLNAKAADTRHLAEFVHGEVQKYHLHGNDESDWVYGVSWGLC